jgi:oligosaccharide repeat unit polymerase
MSKIRIKRFLVYAAVTVASALSGWLISYAFPQEYAAQAKISDEYKTTDLAIGLNSINVMMRDLNPDAGNQGTDDIEIYSKILESRDYLEQVGRISLPDSSRTYSDYLKANYRRHHDDILKLIDDNVNYNINFNDQTLELQVKDKDPEIAGYILGRALSILKKEIEDKRINRALIAKENAARKCDEAFRDYQEAKEQWYTYADSHTNASSNMAVSRLKQLEQDYNIKYDIYQKAREEYARADFLVEKENTSFAVVKVFNISHKRIAPVRWSYAIAALLVSMGFCFWHYGIKRRRRMGLSVRFDFGDWFSPWSITIVIWAVILGFYYLLDNTLYPITSQFFYCLIIWLPIFVLCSFLTYNAFPGKEPGGAETEPFYFNKTVFNLFFVLTLVITPLYVKSVLEVVLMFGTDDIMNNVRTLAIYGDGKGGILNYSMVINQTLLVVALWAHPKIPMWKVVILAIACIMNSLAIMEKGTMFFVFVSIAFVLFEKRVITLRSILVFSAIVLVVFYLFNLGRAEKDSEYQKEETLLDFVVMYALSPPVAFCQLMKDVTPQFGTNTFNTIYLFLARWGAGDIIVKQKLQQFVWVPIPTNVYTMFQPFFMDFGYRGVAFFAWAYGCASGVVYRLHRNRKFIGSGLYTYMVYALVLQFYQDNLIFSLVFLIQFTFFLVLITQNRVKLSFNIPVR